MSRSGKLENIVFLLLSSPQDSEKRLDGFNYEGNKDILQKQNMTLNSGGCPFLVNICTC